MKTHLGVLTTAISLGMACVSFGEDLVLRVESLVQEAIARNPKILAARERHSALKEKIPQAGLTRKGFLALATNSWM